MAVVLLSAGFVPQPGQSWWPCPPPPPPSCCSSAGGSSLGMQQWAGLTLPSFSCLPLASCSQNSRNHLYPYYKAARSLIQRKKENAMQPNCILIKKYKKPLHEIQKAWPWYNHTSVNFKRIIHQQNTLPSFKEDFYIDNKLLNVDVFIRTQMCTVRDRLIAQPEALHQQVRSRRVICSSCTGNSATSTHFLRPHSEIPDSSQGERLVMSRTEFCLLGFFTPCHTQRNHIIFFLSAASYYRFPLALLLLFTTICSVTLPPQHTLSSFTLLVYQKRDQRPGGA